MNEILTHIKNCTGMGNMAVWSNEAKTFSVEVCLGPSGYAAFRYSGLRLIVHHSGMTIREVANLVAGWLNEVSD